MRYLTPPLTLPTRVRPSAGRIRHQKPTALAPRHRTTTRGLVLPLALAVLAVLAGCATTPRQCTLRAPDKSAGLPTAIKGCRAIPSGTGATNTGTRVECADGRTGFIVPLNAPPAT